MFGVCLYVCLFCMCEKGGAPWLPYLPYLTFTQGAFESNGVSVFT